MYRCSNCGATMSRPLDRCPQCGVLLSGVKCEACGYIGGKTEFINNNHRCPKCNSITYIPGVPRTSTSRPPALNKRLIISIAASVISAIFSVALRQPLTAWALINSALVGLVIYEILYRTRKWSSLKTLLIYIIVATPISNWLYALLFGVEFNHYEYALSLAPLTNLFSAASYPFNLYFFIETAIITGIAYWLIRSYQA